MEVQDLDNIQELLIEETSYRYLPRNPKSKWLNSPVQTPELKYLRKKERFLQQFRKNALGKGNKNLKELMAVDILQNYVKDVLKTASELDDYESHDMYKDQETYFGCTNFAINS